MLPPPQHVGRVPEGTDHEDAGALLRVGELAREDRHGHAEQRRHGALAEQGAVARVLRMRGDADAGRQELGPRRRDHEAPAALDGELEVVEGAGDRPVFGLRLGDRGLEVRVPHGRRLGAVELALLEEVAEGELRDAPAVVVDGLILEAPVDGDAEPMPELLVGPLVLAGHFEARLDEVRARDAARRLLAVPGARGLEAQAGLVGRARDRSARGSSSARAARWGGRCRPSPSGRRRSCRACAAGAPRCRCACS